MAFSLDGPGGTGVSTHGATTVAATMPATNNNDNVLLALVQGVATGVMTSPSISGVVSSPSLTWARRQQAVTINNAPGGDGAHNDLEIWWAYAPTPTLVGSIGVTATFTAAIDAASMHIFAVSGANDPTSPWDINGALPGASSNISATAGAVDIPGVATTASSTFAFAFYGSSEAASPNTNDTGVTTILGTTNNNGPGTFWSYTRSEYIVYSTPKSTFTFHMLGNVANWGALFDALAGSRIFQMAVTLDAATLDSTLGGAHAFDMSVTLDAATLTATLGTSVPPGIGNEGIMLAVGL